MITKQLVKSRNMCKLNFELAPSIEADEIQLLADFNNLQGTRFEKLKSGKWKLVQEVIPGHSYQFRYRLVQGGSVRYVNDDTADDFITNSFGSENAVIHC